MIGNSWTCVDRLGRPYNLCDTDYCFYYLTYTPRAGYQYSNANQLIFNYKIPLGGDKGLISRPDRRQYKVRAIDVYAWAIVEFMESKTLINTGEKLEALGERIGLVPAPPSMTIDDPEYDDRNYQTCLRVCNQTGFKLCRDIETGEYIGSSHAQGTRDPILVESSLERIAHDANDCEYVFIIDDVLASGAHYVAIKSLLEKTGCSAPIFGLFFAKAEED